MFRAILYCLVFGTSSIAIAQSVEKQTRAFNAVERERFTELISYRERSDALVKAYKELGFEELAARKDSFSTKDIELLFEAQFTLNFYAKDSVYLAPLESSFSVLLKRDKVERKHVRKLFEIYVLSRRFDAASELTKKYPTFNLDKLPNFVENVEINKNERAIWLIDKAEKRLTREPVRFSSDWQLVAISHPLCHFSKNALTYIKNDKALAKSLEGHFTLIGPQDGNLHFDVMQKWNAENPSMPIYPVDQQIAFTEFDQWSTPTFYFMKAGKVVYQFNGWPKEGNRAQLDEGLRKIGAISGEATQKK